MIKCDWHQKKSGFSDRVEWQLIWKGKNHFLKYLVLFSKVISKLCSVANIDDSQSLVQMILSSKLKFQNVQEKSLWTAFNSYNWQHWKFSAGCWKSEVQSVPFKNLTLLLNGYSSAIFSQCCQSQMWLHTVWKFQDFSVIQILHETNFEGSRSCKYANIPKSFIFPHCETLL